jgi:nucleoside diphosphate kinase
MLSATSFSTTQNDDMSNMTHSYAISENKERERTLAILSCTDKLGEIIEYIKKHDYTIITSKRLQLTEYQAKEFYANHKKQTYYDKQVDWLKSTMVCAMVLEKKNAIADWKKLMGPMNYKKAKKNNKESIRAIYGKEASQNASHGSDTEEYAKQEIEYIFNNQQTIATEEQTVQLPLCATKSSQINQQPSQELITDTPPVETIAGNTFSLETTGESESNEYPKSEQTESNTSFSNKEQDIYNNGVAALEAEELDNKEDTDVYQHENDMISKGAVRDALTNGHDKDMVAAENNDDSKTVEEHGDGIEQIKQEVVKNLPDLNESKNDASEQQGILEAKNKDDKEEVAEENQATIIESYIATEPGNKEECAASEHETLNYVDPELVESETSSTKEIQEEESTTTAASSVTEFNSKDNTIEDEKKEIGETKIQKPRPASIRKLEVQVKPSRSRICPPSIIRDKKGVLTSPNNDNKQTPKSKLNRGTTRIARLSNTQPYSSEKKPVETDKPALKKSGTTKISKHLPRVATLAGAKPQQEPIKTENKTEKPKKRISSTKSFITRLTAPTVASENKKATTAVSDLPPRSKVKN